MKHKRRRLTIFDIPNVPVTPVVEKLPGYRPTTLQSIQEEEAAAEVQRRVRQMEDREQQKLVRLFWMRDFHAIDQDSPETPGCYDELYLAKDDNPDADECMKTFNKFVAELPAKTGLVLSSDGKRRLGKYAAIQTHRGGVAITEETLDVMFDRLRAIGVFEITNELRYKPELKTYVAPQEHEERAPKTKPTITDLERLSITSSIEQEREARRIVSELAEDEFKPLAFEWLDSLASAFGLYPTPEQIQKVVSWFHRNGAYWGDRRSYDAVRKYMILVEREWPMSALTESERWELEAENSDLNDYHVRRDLLQRARRG